MGFRKTLKFITNNFNKAINFLFLQVMKEVLRLMNCLHITHVSYRHVSDLYLTFTNSLIIKLKKFGISPAAKTYFIVDNDHTIDNNKSV